MKGLLVFLFLPTILYGFEIDLEQYMSEQTTLSERVSKIEDELVERVTKLENLAKVGTLRSCEEYADYGLKDTGMYLIDPDGPLLGHAPFQVLCNFTSGATEVLHDAGTLTNIEHCHDPGCFEQKVTYINGANNEPIPLTQIDALIQLSDTCVQGFYYECTLAPLRVEDVDYAFWADRNGENNIYFTGSNKNYHSCACHFSDEGCFEEETRGNTCNCDSNLPAPLSDTGIITNMTALPVTKLSFGGLTYDIQSGAFQLGNLKCYGKTKFEAGSSCSALKKSGITRSGFYEIKKPGESSTTTVFCDMEEDGYIDIPELDQTGRGASPLGSIAAWVNKPADDASTEPIPDGWVLCNGTLIEKGPWTGARTPNLNDGHFLRGGDISTQREYQEDQLQDHQHIDPGHSHSASSQSSPHNHPYNENYMSTSSSYKHWCYEYACKSSGNRDQSRTTSDATVSVTTTVNSHTADMEGVTSSYRSGSETRPRNTRVTWIMKCW